MHLSLSMHAHGVGKPAGNNYETEHNTKPNRKNGVNFDIIFISFLTKSRLKKTKIIIYKTTIIIIN